MERKIKYRCGIWMFLLFLCMVLALTGCTRREDVFLEEINSDENIEKTTGKSEKSEMNDSGTEDSAGAQIGIPNDETGETTVNPALGERSVTPIPRKIFVDVCGAVTNPGVYELEEGARIFQAVDAAGGYLPEAAMDYLNRARCLADGQQIYVPTEEEVDNDLELALAKVPEALTEGKDTGSQEQDGVSGNLDGSAGSSVEGDSRINLNTADIGQLSTLSGIGQSKATAIIAYREEHGGFASIEEIMNVEGIKEGTFSKIKDKISTG